MKKNISKAQFDRLASLIDDSFGVADEQGKVLFSVPERLWDDGHIDINESDFAEENIFCKDGFCFYRCKPQDTILYIFKRRDTDVGCSERILRLAAHALEISDGYSKKPTVFFRNLLTMGSSGVSSSELKEYEVQKAMGYVVLAVSFDVKADSDEDELLKELLSNVYPADKFYCVVHMSKGSFAVVCPVYSSQDISDIKDTAELINDTATTEIMISVKISLGTVKSKISELNISYEEAVKAAEIGGLFELPCNCYSYDNMGVYRLVYELQPATCIQFLKETLGGEFFRDKNGPELLSSLRAFLDNNMNISEASKYLYIHRNTLLYRMDKFKKLTGLDVANFDDGVKVRMALMVIKYLEKTAPEELLSYIAFYRKK